MPKISILTTTYNHKDFIGYTIQSILDQSINDWELLIGDDSPGEETWKIIQSYREKYPDKIQARHHTPNK
jgi:glycosyltransferase involved in cell wall biosynthesis